MSEQSDWTFAVKVGVMQLAGLTSIGAGAVHAAAAGLHAEHPTLARLFVLVAITQIGAGLLALTRGGRAIAVLTAVVNLGAVAAWTITRFWGISWIAGLEVAEAAQFMDSATAALGAVAVAASAVALARSRTSVSTVRLGVPAAAVGGIAVAAMLTGTGHVPTHADHSDDGATVTAAADDAHGDEGGAQLALSGGAAAADALAASTSDWPRPWDPAEGIDLSGVDGVTAAQQARAEDLLARSLEELPKFDDIETIRLLGYRSIGDAATGFEHYINYDLIDDDVWLDPTQPESLVFAVDGDQRELVSAMFLAPKMSVDDPRLTEYAGELMTWHVHDNLCWRGSDDGPKVAGLTDAQGNCPDGTVKAGGENPMVHVWITPHPCGPFAALEGAGAGQASDDVDVRTDQCDHDHGDHD